MTVALRRALPAAICALVASATVAHAAGLTGSTVSTTLYNPDLSTILDGPVSAVVGVSNPTYPNGSIVGDTPFVINITAGQIIYNPLTDVTYGGGPFNGFVFDFAGAPKILGVSLDPASNFTPAAISFTGDSVSLNLSANSVTTDSVAILDVNVASVPEPATWAIMLIGLGGLGAALRSRRGRSTAL